MTSARHAAPERPLRALLHGGAPLLVWALHFFASYVLVALLCCRAGDATLRGVLFAASAAALAAIVALLVRRPPADRPLLRAARLGGGVLALVGVAWTTLPMALLPPCACGS
jgi:hypothetical protein